MRGNHDKRKRGENGLNLAAIHVEDVVVGEGLVGAEDDLRLTCCDRRAGTAHVDHFPGRLRSYPVRWKKTGH